MSNPRYQIIKALIIKESISKSNIEDMKEIAEITNIVILAQFFFFQRDKEIQVSKAPRIIKTIPMRIRNLEITGAMAIRDKSEELTIADSIVDGETNAGMIRKTNPERIIKIENTR